MNYKIGEKKFMQIETNVNGQDLIIIKVDRTPEEFKKKIHMERIYKYDAIAKPIKNNIYPIERYRGNQQEQSTKNFKRK